MSEIKFRGIVPSLLAEGEDGKRSVVHKFGAITGVGTTEADVHDAGGVYPFPSTARKIRIKAGGNVADTAAGAGARKVLVKVLDADWAEQDVELVTAGASASDFSAITVNRVLRAYVTDVGAYGVANTGAIVIENETDALVLATIQAAFGQTQQAIYTVPAGYKAYLTGYKISADSGQTAEVKMYRRENADVVAAPFTGKRLVLRSVNILAPIAVKIESPIEFAAKTDIWAAAVTAAGTANVEVAFDLILVAQ